MQHPLRRLKEGARLIRRQASGRIALLFGSEKRGLSNHDLSYCHWLMRIPTREEHSSMNLGQALAVCLYEVVRETRTARPPAKLQLATVGEVERITTMLFDALNASGYVKPGSAVSSQEKVRRLVRRLHMQASDVELWLGMLRQIIWKLQCGRK
jgi:tRNA/rRNA methyltransferase